MSGRFQDLLAFLACGVAFASGGRAAAQAMDQLLVTPNGRSLELSWQDAEESLRGSLDPGQPRAGDELTVNVYVGSFQGTFDGPLEIALRRPGVPAELHTVPKGPTSWHTTFKLEDAGSHVLDVHFRTTHDKRVHAHFEVGEPRVPLYFAWLLLGTVSVVALGFGVFRLRSGDKGGTPTSTP